ncbi:peptidoglycan-binding protein [Bremerella sp. JC770]|uniref:peptidoglycan-binding protein n=1 Tax=Bremerella sp. JC770 TaxID=3232137 RepID=UPI00345B276F
MALSPTYHVGSRGPEVVKIQKRLNQLGTRLVPDGIFGSKTKTAVEQFQLWEQLTPDGIVGPCTWSALFRTEKYSVGFNASFNYMPQKQYTPNSCWRAAAAMVLGRPQHLLTPGLSGASDLTGLPNNPASLAEFAKHLGLRLHHGQSWSVMGLVSLIRSYGPLMVCGFVGYNHCFVIGGIRGDGTPAGTTLKVYDPDGGKIFPEIFSSVTRRFPAMTNYILHR